MTMRSGVSVARAGLAIGLAALAASPVAASPAPQQWQAKAREIYAATMAIPTVAGRGEVPRMAAYLAEQFRTAGFPSEDIHILPHGETAAFVVRYRGDGSSGRKPILLLAHMDVVEAKREDWSYEPFRLTEDNGYFYGRGSADIKSGVAQLSTALIRLRAEGFVPDRDIILAFTGDEETTTESARLLATRWRSLIDAEYALNSDGGGGAFQMSDGKSLGFTFEPSEKTSAVYTLTAINAGGHASRPRSDNAIYDLASALSRLAAHRFAPQADDITRTYFRTAAPYRAPEVAAAMRRFADDPNDAAAGALLASHLDEDVMTRTTCVATRLDAGHAFNALPQRAVATVNCRIFPGTAPEAVREELAKVVGDNIRVEMDGRAVAAAASPLQMDILRAYTQAVQSRFPGVPVIPSMMVGYTDGREFRAAGIPTYGVSGDWLRLPDDDRIHGRDERLAVEAFYGGLDHWDSM
ncbi:MAG: M20/M25/M40 family metallo-hydrolase, partial [Sphingomonadales bacterium]|nr:M20/M25/M40 family metallo-hydrolase [Sphingomonadales bacterium]